MKKLQIIVGGYIGLYPTGGATLDYLQYPLGLSLLGHDVYYIEDTGQFPVFQNDGSAWNDPTGCVNYLKGVMEEYGFKDKWAYRDVVTNKSYGLSDKEINDVCKSTDVFINVSCSTTMRDEYLKIPNRVLIDSDPMFTQIQYAKELEGTSELKTRRTKDLFDTHNHLFTFGENIHSPDCKIPDFNLNWKTTRQPVCMHLWESEHLIKNGSFTTVMNWSDTKRIFYDGCEWGQKDIEFEKFRNIPALFPEIDFEIVINTRLNEEYEKRVSKLKDIGWKILEPRNTVSGAEDYKKFIHNSFAEFSVAKETYVNSKSGWFSCRSACYLASGKPVITQETGWSSYIPSGEGLFAFSDVNSAVSAIREVKSDIQKHSNAAKLVANEYFNSDTVLSKLLEQL